MRRFIKTVALILSVAIISSLCTFGAVSAEETESSYAISDSEVSLIEKLTSFGVISNEYDPSVYATRRDMAKIIAKYINLPSKGTTDSSPFGDVSASDTVITAISGLYNMGIISGDENGKFHPDSPVTYDEALVFIINAVGHKMFAERSGGYPTGYHRIAIQFDMLDDISMSSGKDKATVIDIYKMLDGALSAAQVDSVYYGDGDVQYTLSNTDTFLSANYGIRKYRGKVTGNNFTRLTSHESNLKEEQIEINGNIYDTPGYNFGYLLGYTVDYYLKDEDKSELVFIEETQKSNSTIRVDADDILTSETTADRIYYKEEESEKEYHIQFAPNSACDVIYNSECFLGYGWLENVIPQKGYIEALDNNNDGIYDVLFIYEYDTVVVKSVDAYKEIIVDEITGNTIDFTNDVKVYYAENSKLTPFASITVGSILGIPVNKVGGKASKIYICNQVAEGTITSFDTLKGYEINGGYYKISDEYAGQAITLGLSGKFLLDIYGDIIEYNYAGNSDLILAVPVAVQYETSGFDKSIILKVFTQNGKFEEITLNDKLRIDSILYDITEYSGHTGVLTKLCGEADSSGTYKISTSYLIRYTQNQDKKINSIDMGGNGNSQQPIPGKLNVFADGYKIVRPSYEKILVLRKDTMYGDGITSRQGKNIVFFMTPSDNEIGDEDKYDIATKLELNKWYASETVTISGDTPVTIDDITAYNFGMTDFRTVDVMLVRGGGGNNLARGVGPTTALSLITNVTSAVNKDDMSTGKLYQGTKALGILAEKVTYTTLNSEGVLQADLIPGNTLISQNLIGVGDVVQLGYNGAGEINAVKLISEYDALTGAITPVFKAAGTYISQVSMFYEPNANFVVGSVDLCDAVAGTLSFTAGVNEGLVAVVESKPTVLIYYSDTNKVVEGMISDIQPEDKITMRIYNCYTVKEIVVFR